MVHPHDIGQIYSCKRCHIIILILFYCHIKTPASFPFLPVPSALLSPDLNILLILYVLTLILLLYALYKLWTLCLQVTALLQTLQLQDSARHRGHFALYNCLVLGHSKYKGVQRIYCNPFPAKPFYGSHRLDLVMIRPPGISDGAFVLSPSTVWYARVLLLFSASAATDTGSKAFDCALVSTLEMYDDPENGYYEHS